jgi:hypothetical protein
MILRKIGVLSCAKIGGVVYGAIGLLLGAVFSLIGMIGGLMPSDSGMQAGGAVMGLIFGVGAIIFMPIFYGIGGFVGGAISAFLYNLVSGVVGGVELTLENKPGPPAYAPYQAVPGGPVVG